MPHFHELALQVVAQPENSAYGFGPQCELLSACVPTASPFALAKSSVNRQYCGPPPLTSPHSSVWNNATTPAVIYLAMLLVSGYKCNHSSSRPSLLAQVMDPFTPLMAYVGDSISGNNYSMPSPHQQQSNNEVEKVEDSSGRVGRQKGINTGLSHHLAFWIFIRQMCG